MVSRGRKFDVELLILKWKQSLPIYRERFNGSAFTTVIMHRSIITASDGRGCSLPRDTIWYLSRKCLTVASAFSIGLFLSNLSRPWSHWPRLLTEELEMRRSARACLNLFLQSLPRRCVYPHWILLSNLVRLPDRIGSSQARNGQLSRSSNSQPRSTTSISPDICILLLYVVSRR